jgi:hypothetical protein
LNHDSEKHLLLQLPEKEEEKPTKQLNDPGMLLLLLLLCGRL